MLSSRIGLNSNHSKKRRKSIFKRSFNICDRESFSDDEGRSVYELYESLNEEIAPK